MTSLFEQKVFEQHVQSYVNLDSHLFSPSRTISRIFRARVYILMSPFLPIPCNTSHSSIACVHETSRLSRGMSTRIWVFRVSKEGKNIYIHLGHDTCGYCSWCCEGVNSKSSRAGRTKTSVFWVRNLDLSYLPRRLHPFLPMTVLRFTTTASFQPLMLYEFAYFFKLSQPPRGRNTFRVYAFLSRASSMDSISFLSYLHYTMELICGLRQWPLSQWQPRTSFWAFIFILSPSPDDPTKKYNDHSS
jgi:hypothetical protein